MPDQTTRVLHVFGQMDPGGAELRTLEVMRHQRGDGVAWHFCALSGRPGQCDAEIVRLGGKVHLVRLDARFPLRFMALLRQERITCVHSHVHLSSALPLLLARLAGVPVRVAHFRSTADGRAAGPLRRLRNRLLAATLDVVATRIVGVSQGALESAWGPGWRQDPRCAVVYNGIATAPYRAERDPLGVRKELGLAQDAVLYVHVGRIAPAKNHPALVRAFAEVARRDPRARLVLVGQGGNALEEEVRSLERVLGLDHLAVHCGLRNDVPRLLGAADVMLLPSTREGLPGAVLEGIAAGLPVVASDLPGVREIAAHLPGVTIMPDGAGPIGWAEAAIAAAAGGRTGDGADRLDASPFALPRAARQLCDLWTSRARSVAAEREAR